jgi:hypothetical protein
MSMAQVVGRLLSKPKALNSISNTAPQKLHNSRGSFCHLQPAL